MTWDVEIKEYHAIANWTWDAGDDVCSICRMPFDGCPPDCKVLSLINLLVGLAQVAIQFCLSEAVSPQSTTCSSAVTVRHRLLHPLVYCTATGARGRCASGVGHLRPCLPPAVHQQVPGHTGGAAVPILPPALGVQGAFGKLRGL